MMLLPQQSLGEEVDWDRWAVHDSDSTDEVQYGPLDAILRTIVDKSGKEMMMRYIVLSPPEPLKYLKSFISYLESLPVSKLNRDEQYAYWLNLHNIGVIHLYAVDKVSARRIKKTRGLPGKPGTKWNEKIFTVEGQALSLEDIEQNILIPQWKDPLTLYGLSYGAKGSPPNGVWSFTGPKVHEQLEKLGRAFVNNKNNVRVNKKGMTLSSLYLWNKETLFGNEDAEILDHIRSLSGKSLAQKIGAKPYIIKDKFNWRGVAVYPRSALQGSSVGNRSGGGS